MKKGILLLAVVFFFFLPISALAVEEGGDEEFSDLVGELDKAMAGDYGDISLSDIYEDIKENGFDLSVLTKSVTSAFTGDMRRYILILTQLLVLGILAAVFDTLKRDNGGISGAGHWLILLSFSLLAAKCFTDVIAAATKAMDTAADFLYGLLPLLLGFLATGGGVATLSVAEPLLLFFITVFLSLMDRFFLPLVLVLAALVIVGHLAPKYSFKELQKLLRDVILIALTFLLTIFTGTLSLVGLGVGAMDGLALKTAKLAAGNFIPVVGRHISDALDSLLGASLLMKNTIGLFGVAAVVVVILIPAVKILFASLLFRAVGAVLEPLGVGEFSAMLKDFSSALTVVFALVAATGLLFFFFIFILVGLGNITMMFR
ncbi:MAG: stage III sporulation protein AE [Bacillota bacterium]|nr:stage III sporulation protein AE [Bacillota bacterium]